jgi:hypothetical protein
MKRAHWDECAETSLEAERINLEQVAANLAELGSVLNDATAWSAAGIALSFVLQACEALKQTGSSLTSQE